MKGYVLHNSSTKMILDEYKKEWSKNRTLWNTQRKASSIMNITQQIRNIVSMILHRLL